MTGELTTTPVINGTSYGAFNALGSGYAAITHVFFGSVFTPGGFFGGGQFDFRDIKIGTTGFGSSDVWAPTITTTVVPPFDSLVGSGTHISASGGIITVNTPASTDVYGIHALGGSYSNLYVHFQLRVRLVELQVGFAPVYMNVASSTSTGDIITGVYNQVNSGTETWLLNQSDAGSVLFGDGPAPQETWFDVDLHIFILEATSTGTVVFSNEFRLVPA